MNYQKMLKEILKSSGWTQEQLAAKLGVSFATVNSWLNGRTKPQKSLVPDIQRLYLAQDVTGESEPVYITLINAPSNMMVGDVVILQKDYTDVSDGEAIVAQRVGHEDDIMRVANSANSVETVVRGTRSGGRIYDRFDNTARAQVEFVWKEMAIAKIVRWA